MSTSSSSSYSTSDHLRPLPPSTSVVYRTVWLLLHILFRIYTTVHNAWLHAARTLASRFEPPASEANDRQLIERCRRDWTKLPAHVTVILNGDESIKEDANGARIDADREADEAVVFEKLIRWSELAGIGHISFYDYRGHIEQVRPRLYAKVVAYQHSHGQTSNGNGNSYGNGNGNASKPNGTLSNGSTSNGNGYSKSPPQHSTVQVHLIDPLLNRTHLIDVTRSLCQLHSSQPDAITIPLVDAAVQRRLDDMPEPELAFYFGEHCCTFGLSPWQIRLTEFVRLERTVLDVGLDSFVRSLYRYAKCEQRFGK